MLEYGDDKAILVTGEGTRNIDEQSLADLSERMTTARAQLAAAQAKYDEIKDAAPDAVSEVLSSPLIHQLKQELARLEREHRQMKGRFRPDWPALVELEEGLAQTRATLENERASIVRQVRDVSQRDYEQALAEFSLLERQVANQRLRVQQTSRDLIEYGSLKAEIDARREVLTDLVTRRSETETSGQLRGTEQSNVKVVARASTPDSPVRPRKLFNFGVAVVVGLMLGVGLVLVSHYVDNTIKTEQDISHYGTGIPVLGYVPFLDSGPDRSLSSSSGESVSGASGKFDADLASHAAPKSLFAEAFRNLRTSLLLAAPDHPPRKILVTSCGPGAGKSTIAMNLAIVLTQMDRNVLLIDADLRRARIHKTFGLDNKIGLSSLLSGNASAAESIRESPIPGLNVITSGPTPPNPSELLGSPVLETLLNAAPFTSDYDHVIIDSPPAKQVTDAVILSSQMDATVLVVPRRPWPACNAVAPIRSAPCSMRRPTSPATTTMTTTSTIPATTSRTPAACRRTRAGAVSASPPAGKAGDVEPAKSGS
jgi:capsular exopolysaccharide synthesis family protein